jgi:4-hydroxy-2-oxoheptanedioate aldolase
MTSSLAGRLRAREQLVGYWLTSDNAAMSERIARVGYDYVCVDAQHGLIDYAGCLNNLIAIDAGGSAGVVRVPSNDAAWIGRALDAGAQAVIVPLVNTADEAAAAVRATRYPPEGARSYGPMRSSLRIGPTPHVANDGVACIVMIETRPALDAVEAISSVPGVDGIYVGPSDLALALGAGQPGDGPALPEYGAALNRVVEAADEAGIAAGMHCVDGSAAAQALRTGFTFVSISNDLNHLATLAAGYLADARALR